MGWAKWIISGLGWALMGPIGAVIGFFVGAAVDAAGKELNGSSNSKRIYNRNLYNTTPNDIRISLLLLIASVMKADGKVVKSELDYVKRFLLQNFGEEHTKDMLLILRDLVNKEYSIFDVCQQIRSYTDYTTRMHMFDFLYGVACSDKHCNSQEESILQVIASQMGISSRDYTSIQERHLGSSFSVKNPYAILGIDQTATEDDIKKAYRRLAMKFHPDKVENLGDGVKKNAEKQFREINEAYEIIKKQRGFV